jgi:hypothetical protein
LGRAAGIRNLSNGGCYTLNNAVELNVRNAMGGYVGMLTRAHFGDIALADKGA